MDEQSTVTYEQKLDAASRLRDLPTEQIAVYLDQLNVNWYGILFPGGGTKTIDCELPHNTHQRDDTHKFICGNLNTGPHSFCLYHDFVKDKCPIDGTDLTKVQA